MHRRESSSPVSFGPVLDAAFSLDGTRVLTADWDNLVRIWDCASGVEIARSVCA
jgi:WD40 repeat protein